MSKLRRVLGLDPGLARFGWAVVETAQGGGHFLAGGCLITPAGQTDGRRLAKIFHGLTTVIADYQPSVVVAEELFFSKNVTSALAVGQARGVALLAAAQANLPIETYAPNTIKQAVAGYGRADKQQVQRMVQSLLGIKRPPRYDDTADAMAIAWCGLQPASH